MNFKGIVLSERNQNQNLLLYKSTYDILEQAKHRYREQGLGWEKGWYGAAPGNGAGGGVGIDWFIS